MAPSPGASLVTPSDRLIAVGANNDTLVVAQMCERCVTVCLTASVSISSVSLGRYLAVV